MSSPYMYDVSASLLWHPSSVAASVSSNALATPSNNANTSIDDFQILTPHSSFQSQSEWGMPNIYDIDGSSRNTQVHPHPSSPHDSSQAPIDRTKPHACLETNQQKYPDNFQLWRMDPEKLDSLTDSANKGNGSVMRERVPNACSDLFSSRSSFSNMYEDYKSSSASISGRLPDLSVTKPFVECGSLGESSVGKVVAATLMNSGQRPPGSTAVQNLAGARTSASALSAPDSSLPLADTPPDTIMRSGRQRLKGSSNCSANTTAPAVTSHKLSISTSCTAPLASGAVVSRQINVPSSTVTLSLPCFASTILVGSPPIRNSVGAAKLSSRQSHLSSEVLASQNSCSPPRSVDGKVKNVGGWATANMGVENSPSWCAPRPNKLGSGGNRGKRSDLTPSQYPPLRTKSPRMHDARCNSNFSENATRELSHAQQKRAASEPSPKAMRERHHLPVSRPTQSSSQSLPAPHTSSGVHEIGNAANHRCNGGNKEEVDGFPLDQESAYDLSYLTNPLEGTAEVELHPPHDDKDNLYGGFDSYGSLVGPHGEAAEQVMPSSVDTSSSVQSSWQAKRQQWKKATALSTATPPPLTPPHPSESSSRRPPTWEPVRTNTSAMVKNGNPKRSLDSGASGRLCRNEEAGESWALCRMAPWCLTDLSTALSSSPPPPMQAPHSPLQRTRNEREIWAAVTVEALPLSTSRINVKAASRNGKAPQMGVTQSRRATVPSAELGLAPHSSVQTITTSNGNPHSSKPKTRDASEAAAPRLISRSPISRKSDSALFRGQHHSRVRICTDAVEISDSSMASETPRPPPRPLSSIVVKRRLFDPRHPRPRGPRTRWLPNGKRQANWTAPETHYTTTLADLAAYEEDDSDLQQWDRSDDLWGDEHIGTDVPVTPISSRQDSHSLSSSALAVERVVDGPTVRERSIVSGSNVSRASALQPARFSTPLKAPAVAARHVAKPGGWELARYTPRVVAPSRNTHASAMQDLRNTSVTAGGHQIGIVVDEVDKVLRLRRETELT
ncbi:hypothetical protein, unknown function [Leishmania tarentolae]|uniref:Uncharacterized protein n=1 Tax=Leishmania tarentolae TaxID=5689 RepID=A0A640KND2_LEITA|nr:hypothetical protein, unknown function [Leishmania tarentolae]